MKWQKQIEIEQDLGRTLFYAIREDKRYSLHWVPGEPEDATVLFDLDGNETVNRFIDEQDIASEMDGLDDGAWHDDGAGQDYNTRVHMAADLADLHDLLVAFEELRDMEDDSAPRADAGEGIEQRFGIVLSELPTFGGDEPDDTAEVWSWDETHVLVGVGPCTDWEIVSKEG